MATEARWSRFEGFRGESGSVKRERMKERRWRQLLTSELALTIADSRTSRFSVEGGYVGWGELFLW